MIQNIKAAIFRSTLLSAALFLISVQLAAAQSSGGWALRFYGNGTGDNDRVKIDVRNRPVNIGSTDFTIEFWMKAQPGQNGSGPCTPGGVNWISGNIIFDRDIYGNGDYGDFGISLYGSRIAFGVHNGSSGSTYCGGTNVANGQWRHIAVTRRRSDGRLQIYVDGALDGGGSGPGGDVRYRVGRSTAWPNDPYLVIGAEKHDISPSQYPSFRGWIDEVRISNVLRYTASFEQPTEPFITDDNTVALYHFDEGSGSTIGDSSGAAGGPSNGVRRYGGSPAGPVWTTDTPFSTAGIRRGFYTTRTPELTWNRITWATGYEIQVALNANFTPLTYQNDALGPGALASVTPSLADGLYFWRVRARIAPDSWGPWSEVESFTVQGP